MTQQRPHLARRLFVALAALGLLAAAVMAPALHAPAAGAQSPALSGTWRLAGDPASAQASIQQSVEPALTTLAPDLQRLARARIAETTWVPSTITIAATPGAHLGGLRGHREPHLLTRPRASRRTSTAAAACARSSRRATCPTAASSSSSSRWTASSSTCSCPIRSGRTLFLDVTMRSPRFSQEIRFRLAYQRG
ncbi:MAG: hypothetical protein M5U28_01410 [Sandaracinaceae bacterium]|nr:hypothetical protein [Sandaracinaceae bacterium]